MPGRSGQYSGVRGSGAVSPTAPGHETGGEGETVGSIGLQLTECQCVIVLAQSLLPGKRCVGGGPASPGFSRMLLAP